MDDVKCRESEVVVSLGTIESFRAYSSSDLPLAMVSRFVLSATVSYQREKLRSGSFPRHL